MFYTVYRITNQINGKYYIGKHQTENLDDEYFGSGKYLKRAIKKHGRENFVKEILFVFDTEQEMNQKEKELVVISEETYNLCEGGKGGFSYLNNGSFEHKNRCKKGWVAAQSNSMQPNAQKKLLELRMNLDWSKRVSEKRRETIMIRYGTMNTSLKNRKLSEIHKKRIGESNSIHQTGKNNSQFGTMWITNGTENKKIKKDLDIIPDGWYKGRNRN